MAPEHVPDPEPVTDHEHVAAVAGLFADPTRAAMLAALMDGRFATPGELATQVGVSRSTVSGHLARLAGAGVVEVETQGRHRYARLVDLEVVDLIERLGAASIGVEPRASPRVPSSLRHARTCYDHLAGYTAVRFHDHARREAWVIGPPAAPTLTEAGERGLTRLGVDVAAILETRRARVRTCVDWTERRHHLSGAVGAAVLDAWLARRWLVRGTARRALRVTADGKKALAEVLA